LGARNRKFYGLFQGPVNHSTPGTQRAPRVLCSTMRGSTAVLMPGSTARPAGRQIPRWGYGACTSRPGPSAYARRPGSSMAAARSLRGLWAPPDADRTNLSKRCRPDGPVQKSPLESGPRKAPLETGLGGLAHFLCGSSLSAWCMQAGQLKQVRPHRPGPSGSERADPEPKRPSPKIGGRPHAFLATYGVFAWNSGRTRLG